ncbi:unnamed protein product [Fusarium equiseti]|uniref:Hsp70 protein n=1 Tax=Fusarium equiseti TaxID=61235 RepID=A0A8J2NC35_FUSEQ|nr:unnamed protein product [Fusarium equiseti]
MAHHDRKLVELNSEYDDNNGILVIGIDFGTTYSGVAWASQADFEHQHINLITSWPGSGREEGKAPTEVYYEDDKVSCGFDIDSDTDPIKWFKLLILKDEDLTPELRSSEFLLRARQMMRQNEKTPYKLISDYLRMLWKHTLNTITKDRGSAVDALQFHVVITVPAIWKDYARQHMMEAAKKAGILDRRAAGRTRLTFVPEPEAAALATLCEPGRRIRFNDVYLVCDAGGGTVDLITYKITSVNPVCLEEAVEGTGGLCGGIFIDQDFEVIIKNRLGRRWDRLSKVGSKELLKGEWEHSIKPQFSPTGSRKEYLVSIPAEAFDEVNGLTDTTKEPHIKKGRIHFNESHIKKAFLNVFAKIDLLIDAQVDQAREKGLDLDGVMLVGGLGSSPYLYQHLTERHKQAEIRILQSTGIRPRTAICRGAVYKGFQSANFLDDTMRLPIVVTSTISRASYGISYNEHFDEGVHLKKDRYWNDLEEYLEARNQVQWYLTKGENVPTKETVLHEFTQSYTRDDFGDTFEIGLYRCEEDFPPPRKEDSVKRLATIKCKTSFPYSDFKERRNSKGARYIKLPFQVQMVPSGAAVNFTVFVNGQMVGSSHVNISYS